MKFKESKREIFQRNEKGKVFSSCLRERERGNKELPQN